MRRAELMPGYMITLEWEHDYSLNLRIWNCDTSVATLTKGYSHPKLTPAFSTIMETDPNSYPEFQLSVHASPVREGLYILRAVMNHGFGSPAVVQKYHLTPLNSQNISVHAAATVSQMWWGGRFAGNGCRISYAGDASTFCYRRGLGAHHCVLSLTKESPGMKANRFRRKVRNVLMVI